MRTTPPRGPKVEGSGLQGLGVLALALVAGAGCSNREHAQQTALSQPSASAEPTSSVAPLHYDPRNQGSPDAAVVAAPLAASVGSAPAPAPAPVPSVLLGQAACDACLAAERAGVYLTPEGVSHYLAGCDDDKQRAACLTATKQSLPKRARQLALEGKCDDAHALAQFAERTSVSSPALTAAVKNCRFSPAK